MFLCLASINSAAKKQDQGKKNKKEKGYQEVNLLGRKKKKENKTKQHNRL